MCVQHYFDSDFAMPSISLKSSIALQVPEFLSASASDIPELILVANGDSGKGQHVLVDDFDVGQVFVFHQIDDLHSDLGSGGHEAADHHHDPQEPADGKREYGSRPERDNVRYNTYEKRPISCP